MQARELTGLQSELRGLICEPIFPFRINLMVAHIGRISDVKRLSIRLLVEAPVIAKDNSGALCQSCYGEVCASEQRCERVGINSDEGSVRKLLTRVDEEARRAGARINDA